MARSREGGGTVGGGESRVVEEGGSYQIKEC